LPALDKVSTILTRERNPSHNRRNYETPFVMPALEIPVKMYLIN